MDLKAFYDKLYHESVVSIRSDSYQIDPLIDSVNDCRFGITLLFRPDDEVKNRIQHFLSSLSAIEPNQYYYHDSDLHITVMSIISCYEGFSLDQIEVDKYVQTILEGIKGIGPFNLSFIGLTASPSCLMVQGFTESNALEQIRDRVREEVKKSGLKESIDKRYTIQTAHSTIVRLREKLRDKEGFLDRVEACRDVDFGTCTIDAIELVFNDWYHRKEKVIPLFRFDLR